MTKKEHLDEECDEERKGLTKSATIFKNEIQITMSLSCPFNKTYDLKQYIYSCKM